MPFLSPTNSARAPEGLATFILKEEITINVYGISCKASNEYTVQSSGI